MPEMTKASEVRRLRCDSDLRTPRALRLIFASDPMSVRLALRSVLASLAPLELDQDARGTVELVLAEVANNIVEHAYGADAHGMIELAMHQNADGLFCEVVDDGAEMPDGVPPSGRPLATEGCAPTLPEGGFGWFLIHQLAENICYRRENGRNRLSFRVRVDAAVPRS